MSFIVSREFVLLCPADMVTAINNDPEITDECSFIRIDNNTQVTFYFDGTGPLSPSSESALDTLIDVFVCPPPPPPIEVDDNVTSEQALWSSQQISDYVADAVGPGSLVGTTFGASFVSTSAKTKNSWLRLEGVSTSSDQIPLIVPWGCELLSLTYTNASNESDCTLEVWTAPIHSDPRTTKNLMYYVDINSARSALVTDFGTSDVGIPAGSKVAVFLRSSDNTNDRPVVQLTFKITSATKTTAVIDTFDTDFS